MLQVYENETYTKPESELFHKFVTKNEIIHNITVTKFS